MKLKIQSTAKILETIGRKLKMLRLKSGFTTAKSFSDKNGLPQIQYWKVEHGKANITMKTLNNLLTIHRMKMDKFFCKD